MARDDLADDLWTAVSDAVHRCRRRSPAWWRGARAEAVAALVATLAAYERGLAGAPPAAPARPARDDVLSDQLAVVGADLADALRATPDPAVAARAAADVRATVEQVDPR